MVFLSTCKGQKLVWRVNKIRKEEKEKRDFIVGFQDSYFLEIHGRSVKAVTLSHFQFSRAHENVTLLLIARIQEKGQTYML